MIQPMSKEHGLSLPFTSPVVKAAGHAEKVLEMVRK